MIWDRFDPFFQRGIQLGNHMLVRANRFVYPFDGVLFGPRSESIMSDI